MAKRGSQGLSDLQKEQRRSVVAKWFNYGLTHLQIAHKVTEELSWPCSRQQVTQDLKLLFDRLTDEQKESLEDRRIREIQKINFLEEQAWEAWERSKSIRKISTVKTKRAVSEDAMGKPVRLNAGQDDFNNRQEDQYGDPRYLSQVQWCISKRCELLGLTSDTAINFLIQNNNQTNVTTNNFSIETLQEMRKVIDKRNRALEIDPMLAGVDRDPIDPVITDNPDEQPAERVSPYDDGTPTSS